ncbi:MAG: type II secretion system protein N [Alteromonadaceae bacterium]|nr:type II secretion system protein N [Alteromonadaceae bacterium]
MSESRAKPFLHPLKVVLLLVLGVIVFGVTMVVHVPAGWIWQQVKNDVTLPAGVHVDQLSGQLWTGAARMTVAGYPALINWRFAWPDVAGQALPISLRVQTGRSDLQGNLILSWPQQMAVNARGHIGISEFRELIRQSGGAMIEGDVSIERLSLNWSGEARPQVDGEALWPGGQVTWPMGSGTGQAVFPPMRADLESNGQGVALTVAEQGGAGPAALANLHWDGMMDLRVFKRMVDLAGQPWSDSAAPGDVVFRVRQPVIPGGL